ncbi:prostaglandin E synthase 3-like [Limulus polyphemus]|uniref:Prostaglandin E synthase 3-like n=1 Tax=Limulus polyphemus TaxID=6850 RepID=A0ABM1BIA6_LIMPO|nr:prostaglandin E synthase 3-like [Limulus polyphemus]
MSTCLNANNQNEVLPPPVLWAQRKHLLYVKIALEDCKNPTIKLETDKLFFRGKGGTENKEQEVVLEFLKKIKPEESRYAVRGRGIEFILIKSEEGPYWSRLLKDDKKHHWLKVDFNKWADEDESEDELNSGTNFEEMMRQMGGLDDSGGGDLSALDKELDSDDEDLPNLE